MWLGVWLKMFWCQQRNSIDARFDEIWPGASLMHLGIMRRIVYAFDVQKEAAYSIDD